MLCSLKSLQGERREEEKLGRAALPCSVAVSSRTEKTKCPKESEGAAAAGVFGFSVHQREICGVVIPSSLKVFMRRVLQQWKFPDIFQVLASLAR